MPPSARDRASALDSVAEELGSWQSRPLDPGVSGETVWTQAFNLFGQSGLQDTKIPVHVTGSYFG